MNRRIELHEKLCELLGSNNVYFNPPENIKLRYPCIIYELEDIYSTYADNSVYKFKKRYLITLITKDPDSELVDILTQFNTIQYSRRFVSDNLIHDVFVLYW